MELQDKAPPLPGDPGAPTRDFVERALRRGFLTPSQAERCREAVRSGEDGERAAIRLGLLTAAEAALVRAAAPVAPGEDPRPGPCAEAEPLPLVEFLAAAFAGEIDARVSDSPPPPVRLTRYEIVDTIGRGGMGTVYLARDRILDRLVAVKCIQRADLEDDSVERFRREARAAARLRHPNIVTVHDVGEEGGTLFFTMDHIPGRPLGKLLESGPLPQGRTLEIFQQMADALAYAHREGILHRDLKPDNIMVDAGGRAYLMDFGIARERLKPAEPLTVTGMFMGTPSYMSPEQAQGHWNEVDETSDVYGLGASLYDALTGMPPFDHRNMYDVLDRIVREDPLPLRRRNPGVAQDLESIVMKCLEKDRARRYRTAAELSEDLSRFLRGEPVRARPVRWPNRMLRRIRRRKGIAALAIVTVALSCLVIGVFSVRHASAQRKRDLALRLEREGRCEDALREMISANSLWGSDGTRGHIARLRQVAEAAQRSAQQERQEVLWALELSRTIVRLRDATREDFEWADHVADREVLPSDAEREDRIRSFRWKVEEIAGESIPLGQAWVGLYLFRLGETDRALRELDGACVRSEPLTPLDPFPFLLRAQLWLDVYRRRTLARLRVHIDSGSILWLGEPTHEMRDLLHRARGDLERAAGFQYWERMAIGPEFKKAFAAWDAVLRGEFSEAAEWFAELSTYPHWTLEGRRLLGLARLMQGRYADAAAELEFVLDRRPRWADVHVEAAMACLAVAQRLSPSSREYLTWCRRAAEHDDRAWDVFPDVARFGVARLETLRLLAQAERALEGVDPSPRLRGALQEADAWVPPEGDDRSGALGALARLWTDLGCAEIERGHNPMDEYDQAISLLDEALARNPTDLVAISNRAATYFRRAQAKVALLQDPEEECRRAIADASAAIRVAPDESAPYNCRASAYRVLAESALRRGRLPWVHFKMAVRDFDGAIERLGASIGAREIALTNRGAVQLQIAWARIQTARSPLQPAKSAIEDFRRAISLGASSARARSGLGLSYVLLGLWGNSPSASAEPWFQMAVEEFDRALADQPAYLDALANRAAALVEWGKRLAARGVDPRGKFLDAMESLDAVLSRQERDVRSMLTLAQARYCAGDWERAHNEGDPRSSFLAAIENLERILSLDPNMGSALALRGSTRVRLGELEEREGGDPRALYRAAVEDLTRAIALDLGEDAPTAYNARALACARLGRLERDQGRDGQEWFDRALRDFEHLRRRHADSPFRWMSLADEARLWLWSGRPDRAVECLRAAVQLHAGDPELEEALQEALEAASEF